MPRVNVQTKSKQGRDRFCETCGRKIEPGEKYHRWDFRYGGAHFSCKDHHPKPSQLTQSKMATVYASQEDADVSAAETIEAIVEQVEALAETAREVVDEYREAAEPFGGEGENAERADELEGWVDELENFDPEEVEEFDEEAHADEARERSEDDGRPEETSYASAMDALRREHKEEQAERFEEIRSEAEDLINGCPL